MGEFNGIDPVGPKELDYIRHFVQSGKIANSGAAEENGTYLMTVSEKQKGIGRVVKGKLMWSVGLVGKLPNSGALYIAEDSKAVKYRNSNGREGIVPVDQQRRVGFVYGAEVSASGNLVRPGDVEPLEMRGYHETLRMLEDGDLDYPGQRLTFGDRMVRVASGFAGDKVDIIQFKRRDKDRDAICFVVYNKRLRRLIDRNVVNKSIPEPMKDDF